MSEIIYYLSFSDWLISLSIMFSGTALEGGGWLGDGGVEQKSKRTPIHGQQCGGCGGRGYKEDKW